MDNNQDLDQYRKQLCRFNANLSIYLNMYMDASNCNETKLNRLIKAYRKISKRVKALLAVGYDCWTEDSMPLLKKLQESKEEMEGFIKEIDHLKEITDNIAQVLGFADKALALAAGIASKC